MKTSYIYLGVIAILLWNGMLIKRDKELFNAYDKVCVELPQHPKCRYAK
jgi:hypothetical protein